MYGLEGGDNKTTGKIVEDKLNFKPRLLTLR